MRATPLALCLGLAALVAAPDARAVERQLQLAARPGFAWSSGTSGGPGATLELGAHWGLNDAWSLYGVGAYTLALPATGANSPRHGGSLAVGALYAFDYLRVVPYVGLGARVDLLTSPDATWLTPSVEGRVGATWLLNRAWALDAQVAYAFPFAERDRAADLLSVSVGAMRVIDL